jgi:hypothetical protein
MAVRPRLRSGSRPVVLPHRALQPGCSPPAAGLDGGRYFFTALSVMTLLWLFRKPEAPARTSLNCDLAVGATVNVTEPLASVVPVAIVIHRGCLPVRHDSGQPEHAGRFGLSNAVQSLLAAGHHRAAARPAGAGLGIVGSPDDWRLQPLAGRSAAPDRHEAGRAACCGSRRDMHHDGAESGASTGRSGTLACGYHAKVSVLRRSGNDAQSWLGDLLATYRASRCGSGILRQIGSRRLISNAHMIFDN